MSNHFDVVVAGLGAMGSAAVYHLAKAGCSVLGLDAHTPPHSFGSSHGLTRIIREAYWEHPLYVPLVRRAYELWADLELESGEVLYRRTGGLMIGMPGGSLVGGTLRSIREHGIGHEVLSVSEIASRYPVIGIPDDKMVGVLEHRAGMLFPEKCIEAHLRLAAARGAELRYGEPVAGWKPDGSGVRVSTPAGEYRAGRLLISAGAWASKLLEGLGLPLSVERQVLVWFKPSSDPRAFEPENLPIFLWEYGNNHMIYGFPDTGQGVKVAFHHNGRIVDPDRIDRTVGASDIEDLRIVLSQFMPGAGGEVLQSAVCMYTNTPDGHFLIDFYPHSDKVLIASPCSGHGFKFAPAIGEALCRLSIDGKAGFDLSPFRLDRIAFS